MYQISFTDRAKKELAYFKKYNQQCYKKAERLLNELIDHPYTGTGHPEPLKHEMSGLWSRRLDKEHRMVYRVDEGIVLVEVLSMRFHYQ